MHETFEHTADIGLRVRNADLSGLFAEAAEGLISVIVENPQSVRPDDTYHFQLQAEQLDELLHDWLDELLFAFHARHVLFARFDIEIGGAAITLNESPGQSHSDANSIPLPETATNPPYELKATARGEPVDPTRHAIDQEVKAVTYHGLKLTRQSGDWLAEVVLDI
jgi:SHS2 domain-containing protein